ncbi:hypothetical protein P5G65_23710 [Paenibacillus chondroitinus]|uniref:Uncharacterized protein n=1 Tax=Paenibacillus chondroitinus TaxID=59842 RepID=A0ABU6DJ79_9BACL|nr:MULTISPECIES: hypothetical protein [Paenibacillus]MCY9659516.1 hypothetical protein [Paenibacillus anseongense]MEB4796911.1 hypothetical protein [Paenibacillus chondroitinus]
MKRIEWLIAIILVVIGLSCLTMSATSMMKPESIRDYLSILLKICLWSGIPILIAGIVYMVVKKKKRE